MKITLAAALATLSLTVASWCTLPSHHSCSAQYAAYKAIRVTGTLTKTEWTNPHSDIYSDVKEGDGSVAHWSCEAGSLGSLSRQGFKQGTVKFGETLVVD